MGWPIVGVCFDLGANLVKAEAGVKSDAVLRREKPTQHFVASLRSMRPLISQSARRFISVSLDILSSSDNK